MKEVPIITMELSHTPLGPSWGDPAVDVCAALSLLTNSTLSPGAMVNVAGRKQSGSQPGVDEPTAFSTVYVSAKTSGVA